MKNDLVSIITPCYNSGKFCHRLFDSILDQNYPSIEMYVVDDGSTDNTKKIIECYIDKFNKKGYTLNYIYQSNSGQSTALNNALKKVKGKYLVWPDSDDYYSSPLAISKMVSVLSETDDTVSMVRCLSRFLNEKSFLTEWKVEIENLPLYTDLFEDCLFEKNNYYFLAGGYMAKMHILDQCIINREIYTEKNAGQNWQLMLPLLYQHHCITIKEYLYSVLIREESHSRGQFNTLNQVNSKYSSYENTLINTLKRIPNLPLSEKERYISDTQKKYLYIKLDNCIRNNSKREASKIIKQIIKNGHDQEISSKKTYKKLIYKAIYIYQKSIYTILNTLGI